MKKGNGGGSEGIKVIGTLEEDGMIERTFQWKFIGKFAGIVLAGLGATVLSLYTALPRGEARYYAEVIRSLVTAEDVLSRAIAVALIVESLVISAAVVLIAVLTSHKIAGPVYKLKRTLDELANARVPGPIRFRKNDQLRKTAATFNVMLAGLEDRFRSLGEACGDVAKAAGKPAEPVVNRGGLKGEIDRLGDALRRFTL